MRLVIDVQPFAACGRRLIDQGPDQRLTDALPPVIGVDDGVEDERVRPAVPAGVHKPDQGVTFEGTDPGQAVMLETPPPWLGSAVPTAEGASVQVGQHLIINREPDFELNMVSHGSQHQMSLSAAPN